MTPPAAAVQIKAPQRQRAQPPKYALRLDGEGFVEVLNTALLESTPGGFTVECWLRTPPVKRPAIVFSTFVGQGHDPQAPAAPASGWWLEVSPRKNNGGSLNLRTSQPGESRPLTMVGQPLDIADGRWRHVAVCLSDEFMRLFLDGQSVSARSNAPFPLASSRRLTVGSSGAADSRATPFLGDICGLRISSGARYCAAFQPAADMSLENDDATLALLDFSRPGDEGAVRDISGHSRHGKVVGARWVGLNASAPGMPPGSNGVVTATQPARHSPPPSAEQIAAARNKIRELFADHIAASKKPPQLVALAGKLARMADQTRDDPALQYTLYLVARDLAAQAVASEVALRCAQSISWRFETDVWELKSGTMAALMREAKLPQDLRMVAATALRVAADAVTDDRYDIAEKLLNEAANLAVKAHDDPLANQARVRLKELDAELARWKAAQQARATLSQAADDLAANLVLGKYLCFSRGEWSQGLPLLVKSNDSALKSLAEQEVQAPPASAEQRMKLADGWYRLGQSETAEAWENNGALVCARHWSLLASPDLQGADKARADDLAAELAQSTRPIGKPNFGAVLPWLGDAPGQVHRLIGHTGDVPGLSLSASGKLLASCGYDGTVRLWDLSTGKEIRQLPNEVKQFRAVAISPDAQFVFAGAKRTRCFRLERENRRTGRAIASAEKRPAHCAVSRRQNFALDRG